MKFVVRTTDVDGSSRRSYRTRAGAWRRFGEMSGHTPEVAISEAYHFLPEAQQPTRETVRRLRTVSDYGTVVAFEEVDDGA